MKAGRLNMARLQAEELVLRDLILLTPESAADDPEPPEAPVSPADLPMVVDRSHPLWEQVNAEQEELAQDS